MNGLLKKLLFRTFSFVGFKLFHFKIVVKCRVINFFIIVNDGIVNFLMVVQLDTNAM